MANRELGNWLEAFLDYAKPISETPTELLYWSGVSAIAGALQRKVWIDQARYQLYPNFYIVFVADPGVIQKSTTINSAIRLLKKVPTVTIAPDATTWEGFIKFMEEKHQSDDVLTDDLTKEQTKSSAVTISASELSTFLDPKNMPMMSALTKLWDCEDIFVKLTKFSGTEELEKPCVNLIGGTTPAWIRESFDRWSREGGFVSRTIFLYGSEKRQLIAFPKTKQPKDHEAKEARLIADLNAISSLKGEYRLHVKMIELGEEWYREHDRKVKSPGYVESSGFKDRKQAHILKLCMVIAASLGESLVILPEHWLEAVERINLAEQDFPLAFSSIDDRTELRPYNEFLKVMRKEKKVERQSLYARYTNRFMLREMKGAIEAMREAGLISLDVESTRMMINWKGT